MKYDYYFTCNNSFIGKVVHHKDCRFLRNNQKKFLGSFSDYPQALETARKSDPETDQCQACQELQHKTESPLTKIPAKKAPMSDNKVVTRLPDKLTSEPTEKSTGHINRVPRKHL